MTALDWIVAGIGLAAMAFNLACVLFRRRHPAPEPLPPASGEGLLFLRDFALWTESYDTDLVPQDLQADLEEYGRRAHELLARLEGGSER